MLKQEIKFEDFDGNERTEVHYFNLTEAECIRREMVSKGGFAESLKTIGETQDPKEVIEAFEDIIRWSYGIRSEDGVEFQKSSSISDRFMNSAAFNAFFMMLITDAEFGARFVRNVMPRKVQQEAAGRDLVGVPQDHKQKEQTQNVFEQANPPVPVPVQHQQVEQTPAPAPTYTQPGENVPRPAHESGPGVYVQPTQDS